MELDDMFNVLALLSLIGYFATWEYTNTIEDPVISLRLELAEDMLFWTCLYLVKATFLALIHSIFNISVKFRKAWWAVTLYTFIAFWPVVLSELWQCGAPSDYANPGACDLDKTMLQVTLYKIRFAFHISSDCFILALPLAQIKKLHTSRLKKITIGAVFALSIVDIIGAIIKTSAALCDVESNRSSVACGGMGTVWGILEPAIAVIVCALPAYRPLLPSSRRRRSESLEQRKNIANWRRRTPTFLPLSSVKVDVSLLREMEPAHIVQLEQVKQTLEL